MCVCVYVCHVYAGHLPIDGSQNKVGRDLDKTPVYVGQ